jgi:23S rRNA (cytidine1920-2'-O)/16S rRNA (cytidine1409-2'-O)-methyltransferase
MLPEPVRLAVVDVSFISLDKVLAPVASTIDPTTGGRIVPLVKPQFEVGRGATDRGVVRDPDAHRDVLERVSTQAAAAGLEPCGVVASPILGPEGNREFLLDLAVPAGWTADEPAVIPADWAARVAAVTR